MLKQRTIQDLKDVTNCHHYETYRCLKLTSSLEGVAPSQLHPLAQLEMDGEEHLHKVDKMQREMEDVFRYSNYSYIIRLRCGL